MPQQKRCKKCGVPKLVHKDLCWQDNGILTEVKDPSHRMLFTESENLICLFTEIENLIGIPVDRVIIESKSLATKEYLEKILPPYLIKILYIFKPSLIVQKMSEIGRAYGYGKIELLELKKNTDRGDYLAMTIEHPYSMLSFTGDNLGGMEAGTGRECVVKTKDLGGDKHLLELWVSEHPPELKEHIKPMVYPSKPGKVELERCPECNTPFDVASYDFDLEKGVISNPETGVRMAIFGPAGLESAFQALEEELGDSISESIIEAQRLYTLEHMELKEWLGGEEKLRRVMAVRGYGLVTGFDAGTEHLTVSVRNISIPQLTVGTAKGVFEKALKLDSSTHEWHISGDGELYINIRT